MQTLPTPSQPHNDRHPLSLLEQHRLTLFKWRYTLETLGFAAHEVEDLMFLTWLRATARVRG
jgi:hypothetical protein